MKKLILTFILFTSIIFAQNPLTDGRFADLEGNLRDVSGLWFNTIDNDVINVLGGKFSLTNTGADVQRILDNVDDANVSVTEFGYLNGVTSAIQTQLDLKAPKASPIFTGILTVPTIYNTTAIYSNSIFAYSGNYIFMNAIVRNKTSAGITASTTQTQGQGSTGTSQIIEVSTVTNPNDVITLSAAKTGTWLFIINNGANTLQIFPATDDNLGAGLNNSTTLAAGSNVTFVAYDATNWEVK